MPETLLTALSLTLLVLDGKEDPILDRYINHLVPVPK